MISTSLFCFVLATFVAIGSGQFSGSVSTNPQGGLDTNIAAIQRFGTDKQNVGAGLFAAGNTNGGPVTTGGFADVNLNQHRLSLTQTNTPGFGNTLTGNARVNLLQNNNHRLDANAFTSKTNLENGFNFNKHGANLDYNHARGHGATVGVSNIPNFGSTVDLSGKANLWNSMDRRTSFDLTGQASRTISGPFAGRNNFGGGFGLTHRF